MTPVDRFILRPLRTDPHAVQDALREAATHLRGGKPMHPAKAKFLAKALDVAADTAPQRAGEVLTEALNLNPSNNAPSKLNRRVLSSIIRAFDFENELRVFKGGEKHPKKELVFRIREAFDVSESTAKTYFRDYNAEQTAFAKGVVASPDQE